MKMNSHNSEWFKTSAQQTDPVTAKSHQLSAKSKALIQMWTYSEMIKYSSYKSVSWYRYTGNVPMIAQSIWCYLRHHAVPVQAVFNLTH